eukprot:10529641-Heterocapsa_arctica.AAC.1
MLAEQCWRANDTVGAAMGDWVCGICDADNCGGRVVCRMPRCRVRGPPVRTPQALCLWMRCVRRRWSWAAR